MKKKIGRLINDKVENADIVAMTTMILSVPRPIQTIDAFVVLPGMGEFWRVRDAIIYWEKKIICSYQVRFLIITGHNKREKTSETIDIERLKKCPYELTHIKRVICGGHAEHTKEQTDWVCKKVQELGIKSIALFASPYHIVRAYLTLLKSVLNMESENFLPIIPVPTPVAPGTIIPETGTSAWEMVPGEVKRIIEYQKKGDVASLGELKDYIEELWFYFKVFKD